MSDRSHAGMPDDQICGDDDLLTQQDAADLTGYCKAHLSQLSHAGKGPPTTGYRKSLRYPRGPLLAWAAGRKVRQGEGLRVRWNGGQTKTLVAAIHRITERERPMTIRQLYYQLVISNLIDKTEDGYDSLQQRLARMRDTYIDSNGAEGLDPDVFFDSSRHIHRRQSFATIAEALQAAARYYRKDFWSERDERVAFWLEKEGLAEQIKEVAWPYDIPVYVAKGFSSISYVRDFVDWWNDHQCPTTIYYMRDLDPSGFWGPRALKERLARMLGPLDADQVTVKIVAISLEQIAALDLGETAQPTKDYVNDRNSHFVEFAAEFGADMPSYELDALSRSQLQAIAMDCIRNHVDDDEHNEELAAENEDREKIADAAGGH